MARPGETWQIFQQIFEPSIGCLISPYNLAFLRANLAMGEIANFSSKINKVGVRARATAVALAAFATNCDGTACAACCEEYSDAAFASRIARAADARLTRDQWVPTLSRETDGEESQIFEQFYTGQMTVRDCENLCKNLFGKKSPRKFDKFPPHRPKTPQKCHQNNVLSGNKPLSHRCLSVGSGLPYTITGRLHIQTRASSQNFLGRGCIAPGLDGARAGPLANTLFGAKHGGHCHRQSIDVASFRRQMLRNS